MIVKMILYATGASGAGAGPGYPLQFLSPPVAGFRYFRFYPLRFAVRYRLSQGNKTTFTIVIAKTITVSFPGYTVITALVPAISVSPEATVSPPPGQAQNFSGPVTYTVTAEDGSFAVYTVTVTAPGQGGVTMVFPADAASGALTDTPIVLNKTPIPTTHTLTVSGDFDTYRWRVNGAFKENGKSITLNAADYTAAAYQITLEVTLNGVVYWNARV